MKRWFKILAACLVLLGVGLLGGCTRQAQVTCEMTVEADESGQRVIQVELPESIVRRVFKGSERTVERLMREYCPGQLDWDVERENRQYRLTLTLSFHSLEEYCEKAQALTGKNMVQLNRTGTGMRVEFSLKEYVTAKDFLQWLSDALVEEGYVRRTEVNELFQLGQTYFSYDGKRQSVPGGRIEYAAGKDYDARAMVMVTEPQLEGEWRRTVYLIFPGDLMEKAPGQVQALVEERTPQGSQAEWITDTCVELIFPDGDVESIGQSMSRLLGQGASQLKEEAEMLSPFQFDHTYREFVDVQAFAADTGRVPVCYYVKGQTGDGEAVTSSGLQETPDWMTNLDAAEKERIQSRMADGNYLLLLDEEMDQEEVLFRMEAGYMASSIQVSSVMRDRNTISRDITVTYARPPLKAHQEAIEQYFQNKTQQHGRTETAIIEENFCVQVSMEGGWEQISAAFEHIFSGTDTVSYKRDKTTVLTPSANGYMEEKLDFTGFLPKDNIPSLTYYFQFDSGDTILKDTLDSTAKKENQEETVKATKYTATVGNTSFHIKFTTQVKNLISLPVMALIAFMAAAAAIWYLHGERWNRIMERVAPALNAASQKGENWWQTHTQKPRERWHAGKCAVKRHWKKTWESVKQKLSRGKSEAASDLEEDQKKM